MSRFWLTLAVPFSKIGGCGEATQREGAPSGGYYASSESTASEISIDAAADAKAGLAPANYEEAAGSSDCTEDCSGHEAGFEYAKGNEITDPGQYD